MRADHSQQVAGKRGTKRLIMDKLMQALKFMVLIALSACYYDSEEELYPNQTCDTSDITFQAVIKPIVDANCALSGCHVPGTGRVDYTTYQGIKIVADDGRLRQRVVIERTMPPSGPLSACDRSKIEIWLDQGALNN